MRSIEEITVLVTGATDGLGRSVALELASRGANVLVHGRSRERGERTAAQLRARTGGERVGLYLADFASLAQVSAFADEVAHDHDELHVLINNVGIGSGLPEGRARQESADGYELRFAVNYLAGFLLTDRLLPLLRRGRPARIVNVASLGQQAIEFNDPMLTRGYGGMRAYCQSKLAQVMHAIDLSERLPAADVTANSHGPKPAAGAERAARRRRLRGVASVSRAAKLHGIASGESRSTGQANPPVTWGLVPSVIAMTRHDEGM